MKSHDSITHEEFLDIFFGIQEDCINKFFNTSFDSFSEHFSKLMDNTDLIDSTEINTIKKNKDYTLLISKLEANKEIRRTY